MSLVNDVETALFELTVKHYEWVDSVDDVSWDQVQEVFFWSDKDSYPSDDLDSWVSGVMTQGGGEGDGEYTCMVFKLVNRSTQEETFFKMEGYYASYDGTSWDGNLHQVRATQKLVTFYVPIDQIGE